MFSQHYFKSLIVLTGFDAIIQVVEKMNPLKRGGQSL